ncbi:kinesin-like protein [Aspergillus melleus]|uniref:Kinesin-like protein n=1 Tax=Aspergillus melleus TaxID=138277 RepID=A0ACC3B0B3_9EURO|nr:kinesin-like protein [Aspergillus melleus]
MPTPLPSSFASAAAGNAHDSSRRGDGTAGGEWSRSRMNGATQTFRRPSVAINPSHSRDTSQPASATTPTAGAYSQQMPSNYPSSALRNGAGSDTRYSKEQLLNLYKAQRESGALNKNVADHFAADWNPRADTSPVNGAWGRREDSKDNPSGPEVCWDHGGQMEPLGLVDMTDDEKELFTLSVNSPLKPPPTNASKENAATGTGGRKSSISYTQGHMNNYNTASPSSARPGPRRRETGDSTGNPMSPTAGGTRFFRDEPNTATPPPSLLRRKTDFRDNSSTSRWEEKEKESANREGGSEVASPFGSLKRSSTNPLNVAPGGGNSPWGPSASHSASFSPMGAFGAFSLGTNTAQTPTAEKKAGFGSLRGESRLKGLFSKDSTEDMSASIKEKTSLSSLERLAEGEGDKRSQSPWGETVKTRAGRSETNPFSEEMRSGSAALGGSQDVSMPSQAAPDQLGFSAFGMTSSIPGFRELMQSHENSRNPTPSLLQGHEPTSPTNTNPYQSPHGERGGGVGVGADVDDVETDGSDIQNTHHPGLTGLRDPASAFGSIRRVGSGMDLPSIDRSQTSSAAGNRSFSGLGGLGGLSSLGGAGGWPTSGAVGTPTRERSAFAGGFGDPIFGSMADLQSPSLSTLGGSGLFSSHPGGISGTGSLGRSSKLGSLFPAAMQEQMQADHPARPDLGSLEESMRQADAQQADKAGQVNAPATTSTSQTPVSAVGSIPPSMTAEGAPPSQTPGPPGGGLGVPPAQQRTMVMPDRMRWIYRDPQGNIQGPWTGLEMHDWFKAGFFSPDLQIKKLEDPEFEPLAQLVRRIGNSREPFLVPQIGIPHGPEPNPTGTWTTNNAGTAQPPFPGSFPSFGTTLTAEQQNALERRKQEEQYLMARQKEHLAQQQALMKQMQFQGVPHGIHPHQLQHHSSAHSLHSQPSFGSIASPVGFQPSPIQGPMQQQQQQQQQQQPPVGGFFDAAAPLRSGGLPNVGPQMLGTDLGSSQDQLPALLDRLNVNRNDPFAFGSPASLTARQPDSLFHSQQVASILQDRARLQQEQEQFDSTQGDSLFDQQAREDRLRQFQALRGQEGDLGLPTHPAMESLEDEGETLTSQELAAGVAALEASQEGTEPVLTLSQQVQKAASAQREQQEQEQQQQEQQQQQLQQEEQAQIEAAWGGAGLVKADSAMPQPFPPPPSASPLPAPAAQRNRQNVAESLAANSRSQTQTPVEAPTTSIAPWAKEANELPKGPSLKEIQEAEARNAAQKEELAAAARRAQMLAEQERLSQAQTQAAPGLPSTANWASAGSPATPSSAGSVWNNKGQTPSSGTAKKTLAQIQKEEEARKQRMAAAAAAAQTAAAMTASVAPPTTSPPAPSSTGKRYADLASKAPAAVPSPVSAAATTAGVGGSAWTTVGAGGKAKAPPAAPSGPRSTSGPAPLPASPARPKPATVISAPRTVTVGSTPPANPNRAVEEFTKWAKLTLGKGLNSSINVDDFVQQLLLLPADSEIISDSVYANSQTLDGRRFAEDFIRRRKMADKGIVDPAVASALAEQSTGGWSEVAKKGSSSSNVQREEDNSSAAFKVVAPRKKGKR